MCEAQGGDAEGLAAAPRRIENPAVDPIRLEPVDDITITTLVDNVYDALLIGDKETGRTSFSAGHVEAPQFESGRTHVGLMAEHGFSALVTVRRGDTTSTLVFDAGLSPDAMGINADRLGIDFSGVMAIVLSHGHWDHTGGLTGLAKRRGRRALPMVIHPGAWARRRLVVPGGDTELLLPTLSRSALESEGFMMVERREPSLLVDDSVLITGEVDRTTQFEHGMPPSHQRWDGQHWTHDAKILDDQALVVRLRGRGLVVLTGCGHSGAINIVRHAQRLTGVRDLYALVGGLHLNGPTFEPNIKPTVDALVELQPKLLVPGHCTGWRAQNALATALPAAYVAPSSGSSYRMVA
ncbi:MBL fold metallo-hydrolase [Promicromonospora sp. NPDC060204]|uniref:MBL fold metallo-hydrolase n=1 Tax=Promicromonospora sp. NPDC060204 TaxID=3347071 RepID=UPI003649865E